MLANEVGMRGVAICALMLSLCATGCERRFFHTTGEVRSDGGPLGTWGLAPVSCGRALGEDSVQGRSVVTLLWPDPSRRGKRYHDQGQYTAPEVPMRLDLVRAGEGIAGVMDFWRHKGVQLGEGDCRQLNLTTSEGARALPEGRPTLGGRLVMDCTVEGSHLTADLRFSGCEY